MQQTNYVLPAEWQTQRCVQLTWPHKGTDWADYIDAITTTMVEIAEAITRYEELIIAAQYPAEVYDILRGRLSEAQMQHVTVVECMTNDTWARDHGVITLVADNAFKHSLDFCFNGWGEKFQASLDNCINAHLYDAGVIEGELINYNDFVLEGGSIESDGKGSIFTTSQCLLAPNRNQPLTQQNIENELKKRLNAKRVIWLNHGNLIGDDTDGHIDTTVRICPNDTLLYVKCYDSADEQYDDFNALEAELKELRTSDGAHYKLIPLPMPRPIYYDGERLPATYANFLVINHAVLVPVYNQEDLDRQACERIKEAFPGREIIPIDSNIIIRQHGSIHCLTMQYPI